MSEIRHVRQDDQRGCMLACIAMVTGLTYEQVKKETGIEVGRGFSDWMAAGLLDKLGFAVRQRFRREVVSQTDRLVWPLPPWADVHICSVDAGHGPGTHAVVLLRDGTVLDPACDEPRRWEDYSGVTQMLAVYRADALDRAIRCVDNSVLNWRPRCSHRGIMDPETGEVSCGLEDEGGECVCSDILNFAVHVIGNLRTHTTLPITGAGL